MNHENTMSQNKIVPPYFNTQIRIKKSVDQISANKSRQIFNTGRKTLVSNIFNTQSEIQFDNQKLNQA
jgi:hypothetical protein